MQKLAAFLTILVLIAALYAGVVLLTFRSYFNLHLYTVIVIASILAVLLALLSFLLRKPVQIFIDRIFYRETYDYRQTLLNFTSRMGNILNQDQLAQEMLVTISKAFRISQVVLLLEDRNSGSFSTQFAYPKPKEKPDNELRLLLGSPIVTRLLKESHPLSACDIESNVELKGTGPEQREILGRLELMCPLKSHGKLVGILGLGKKQSNNRYSQDDMQLVADTTEQAGVILENAILFHDIVRDANELKATNKKLIELDKQRIDSLSRELTELQSPLITINNELESMLSDKYVLLTAAQRTQIQVLLNRVNEERKQIETIQVRL